MFTGFAASISSRNSGPRENGYIVAHLRKCRAQFHPVENSLPQAWIAVEWRKVGFSRGYQLIHDMHSRPLLLDVWPWGHPYWA